MSRPYVADTESSEVDGMTVRVLTIEALIEIEASTGRVKDSLVVPLLRETLRQRRAMQTNKP